jgi:hypothetical protein
MKAIYKVFWILALYPLLPSVCLGQMPGHWELTFSAKHWLPCEMAFADSSYGIILADSTFYHGGSFRTTDAGRTWEQIGNIDSSNGAVEGLGYNILQAPTRRDIYYMPFDGYSYISHDGGITWKFNRYSDAFLGEGVCGSRIFPNGHGSYAVRIVGVGLSVYATFDSAQTFELFEGDAIFSRPAQDAIFYDSVDFYMVYDFDTVLHTTDRGVTWSATRLPGSNMHGFIIPSVDRAHIYTQVAQLAPTDSGGSSFDYSTDGGKEWFEDSTIAGARVYAMSSPAIGALWACVGRAPVGYIGRYPFFNARNVVDSIFYSSDNGVSWMKDGSTFRSDTIVQMCWPDSAHGYIMSWQDTTMKVFRYVPNSAGVVSSMSTSKSGIRLLACPVQTGLPFIVSDEEDATISVSDVLGRERISEARILHSGERVELDVHSLASGYYLLKVVPRSTSHGGGIFTVGIVKE